MSLRVAEGAKAVRIISSVCRGSTRTRVGRVRRAVKGSCSILKAHYPISIRLRRRRQLNIYLKVLALHAESIELYERDSGTTFLSHAY